MHCARDRHSACVYGTGKRFLFVSGSYLGKQARSVERYDTFTDTWRKMKSLNLSRSFHASCSAKNSNDEQESVYVFCGFNKMKNATHNSVEKLRRPNVVSSRWQLIELPEMVSCWYHGVVTLNSHEVVILGGRSSEDQPLKCVHVFDTESEVVQRVA